MGMEPKRNCTFQMVSTNVDLGNWYGILAEPLLAKQINYVPTSTAQYEL